MNNFVSPGEGRLSEHMKCIMSLAAILIILSYASATYQRNVIWQNPETLGKDTIRKSPGKGRVYYNLANYFAKQGRFDEAIELFQTAIRVRPTSEEYNNLGLAYESRGMINSAVEMFQLALYLDAANAEAYNNLGKIYLLFLNRNDDAINLFKRAIELRADYTDATINLAAAHIRKKRFHDAIPLLQAVIAKEPEREDAHYNLGLAYHCLGIAGAAKKELEILRGNGSPLADRFERFTSRRCSLD